MTQNFSYLVQKNANSTNYHDISGIPIFGTYKHAEDQLTIALLHIIKVGGEELLQNIVDKAGGNLNSSEMQVATQVPFVSESNDQNERGCRCDGFIFHECGYYLYLESKIACNSINIKQLESYRNIKAGCHQKIILYVTPDENRPTELNQDELWINWEVLLELLEDYASEYSADSLLKVYVQNIILLYNLLIRPKIAKTRHRRQPVDTEGELTKLAKKKLTQHTITWEDDIDEDVLIVGGSWGEPIAIKYGFYACQYGRTFLQTRYMAFYHNNRIMYLFRIVEKPCDIDTLEDKGIHSDYFTKEVPNYTSYSPDQKRCKFFRLQLVHIFYEPIKNDTVSRTTGKRVAYTQNQRYTTIAKILRAKNTSEL